MTEEEIIQLCKKYNIENYTINPDMSIDVNDDVSITHTDLMQLPLQFNKVTGRFDCSYNNLTTLKGCPIQVGGVFTCATNNLSTLEYCPKYVEKNVYCTGNRITTLKHLPTGFVFDQCASFVNNNISDLFELSKIFLGFVGNKIYVDVIGFDRDKVSSYITKNKNPPKKDLPKILSELRKFIL